MKKRDPAKYIITALLVCNLVCILMVILPAGLTVLLKIYERRYVFHTEEIIGMTLDEVEEEYGEFYCHETSLYSDDDLRRDTGYYIVLPRCPALFFGSKPAVVFSVYFRNGIATSCSTEETYDPTLSSGHTVYLDGVRQPSNTDSLHTS